MAGLSGFPVWPTLAVKDLATAKSFYEGVLGYEPMMSSDEEVAYRGVGDSGLSLYVSSTNAGTNKATYASWKVSDLASVMDELRGKGVQFEEYDMPGLKTENGVASWEKDGQSMKAAWFKDPDGNVLCLMEM